MTLTTPIFNLNLKTDNGQTPLNAIIQLGSLAQISRADSLTLVSNVNLQIDYQSGVVLGRNIGKDASFSQVTGLLCCCNGQILTNAPPAQVASQILTGNIGSNIPPERVKLIAQQVG
jgi:hypothetical protein